MSRTPVRKRTALIGLVGAAALILGPGAVAHADPVSSGSASAFGVTATAGGEEVIPPTPSQTAEVTGESDASETLVEVPADPLAVSGTATADTAAHAASDLESTLVTEGTTHDVEGPYNARGEGVVEELDVLLEAADGASLVRADVVRAEAVGVCRGGSVEYSANSEIIGLSVAGEPIPLNDGVQQLIDAISGVLTDSGLNAVVDVQRNVVTVDGDGASVDALVVTLLAAAGDDPLAQVRIAHAEVSGLECGELPECSDTVDNDGDGAIDFPDDSDCTGPEDDSEAGGGGGAGLPRTGGESALALAAALALGAFGVRRLRAASLS